jgi:hypothetical protein
MTETQNARNDHGRSDADQNPAARNPAIGDDATAVLRMFLVEPVVVRVRVRSRELWPRALVKSGLSVRRVHVINSTQLEVYCRNLRFSHFRVIKNQLSQSHSPFNYTDQRGLIVDMESPSLRNAKG